MKSTIYKKISPLILAMLISAIVADGQIKDTNKFISMKTNEITCYKYIKIDGVNIFYREAGDPKAPAILFLHGFPSSSRMYQGLFPLLAGHYHLIAPDYPGFGHSDAPAASEFTYTFDNLARIMNDFIVAIRLKKYNLYAQDYGGPIAFRLAQANPSAISSMIIQNAVTHQVGLSPLWETRKAYWKDRAGNEAKLAQNFTSLDATKQRHIGTNPHPERIDPDSWTDEYAFLTRPGETQIQLDLFYDYQTNVAAYPQWQAWLRKYQPHLLVLWGRYDPSFTVAGAYAYKDDVPTARIVVLDAGHFALEEKAPEMAGYILDFLKTE